MTKEVTIKVKIKVDLEIEMLKVRNIIKDLSDLDLIELEIENKEIKDILNQFNGRTEEVKLKRIKEKTNDIRSNNSNNNRGNS